MCLAPGPHQKPLLECVSRVRLKEEGVLAVPWAKVLHALSFYEILQRAVSPVWSSFEWNAFAWGNQTTHFPMTRVPFFSLPFLPMELQGKRTSA